MTTILKLSWNLSKVVYTKLIYAFHWFRYVEEHIQRTGVAIETQGFTVVTSGKKRESLLVSV